MLNGLVNEEIDKLLERQNLSRLPIRIRLPEMQVLSIRYGGIVRRVATSFAHELAHAVGSRRGLGSRDQDRIKQAVKDAIALMTSIEVARRFFVGEISSRFTLENPQEAAKAFAQGVRGLGESGRLFRDVGPELEHAQAIYGLSPRRRAKLHKGGKPGSTQRRAATDLIAHPLDSHPDVAKRRAIVHQNPKLSSEDMCKRFDIESVVLPPDWSDRFNVQGWRQAYQNEKCRRLIHKLVSVDKRKAQ